MSLLIKLSHFLYYLLCMLALAFIVFFYSAQKFELHVNILLIISLVILPFYNYVFDELMASIKNIKNYDYRNLYLSFWVILTAFFLYIYDEMTFLYITMILSALYYSIARDTRIFFFASMWIFFFVMVYFLFGKLEVAESLSIAAYHFLLMWVGFQIYESFISSDTKWNA